ncbi:MAG TPA: TA system VapC family ribonuclease toxin [Thermoanaerobaculia bacterium]|nr:TA system VapC family ribonuclease toxin [Thermoanaerobaculia bacterium]
MSRHLLDLNTLLALLDPMHVFHEAAHRWVENTPSLRFLTCPLVQNGVIRIASQSAYPNALGTSAEVCAVVTAFCTDSRHEFCPDDISLLDPAHLSRPALLTPSRVTDLYLLALARYHGASLATFDRRIPAEAVLDGSRHLTVIDA